MKAICKTMQNQQQFQLRVIRKKHEAKTKKKQIGDIQIIF